MYRTIFFNLWVALIAFASYFGYTIYKTSGFASPIPTIVYSFVWAIIGFVVAYGLRYIMDFVFYTPEHVDVKAVEDIETINDRNVTGEIPPLKDSTIEFQDESSEDIAQVVRTMLNNDEPMIEK